MTKGQDLTKVLKGVKSLSHDGHGNENNINIPETFLGTFLCLHRTITSWKSLWRDVL